MLHALTLALYLMVPLALAAGAIWALLESKRLPRCGTIFGRAARRYAGANRYATNIMFSAAGRPSAAQGGWVLIDRTLRARRDVRFDVR